MKRDDNDLLREVDARMYAHEHRLRAEFIAALFVIIGLMAAAALVAHIIP